MDMRFVVQHIDHQTPDPLTRTGRGWELINRGGLEFQTITKTSQLLWVYAPKEYLSTSSGQNARYDETAVSQSVA
jgi:hypothetical protein